MDQLLKFGSVALHNRKNNTADSFEYHLFHFLTSDKFERICLAMLPTERMKQCKAGWSILGHTLGEICNRWIVEAVRNERRMADPKLFQRSALVSLSGEELKSETHRVLTWALKSVRDKEKEESSARFLLLSTMLCQEKDVGDEYISTRYDMTMLIRNMAGDGGLYLLTEPYFE